jgi:hypothetical protein
MGVALRYLRGWCRANYRSEEDEADQTTLPPPRFELSLRAKAPPGETVSNRSVACSRAGDIWELQRQGDGTTLKTGVATDAFGCRVVGAKG